jgi:hypothetical protein
MNTSMRFSETMSGTWKKSGSSAELPMSFTIAVQTAGRPRALGTVAADLVGTLTAEGLATDVPVRGSMEISPVEHRRIRYVLDFDGDEGGRYHFDGWKSIDWLRVRSSWTTLPGTVTDASGEVAGIANLKFDLADLRKFVGSMRLAGAAGSPGSGTADRLDLERRRLGSKKGRLEVWYETFNDPATGAAFWLHHEIVAPTDGREAHGAGWAAVFPKDGEPLWERFGPDAVAPGDHFGAGDVVAEPGRRAGKTSGISWDLAIENKSAPIYTFSRLAWERPILPAAQIVSAPQARFSGTIRTAETTYELDSVPGQTARIYGHGNAERWAWLHADLGDGDVLEVVAAVGRRPGMSKLRPLPLVQLRFAGKDWPSNPLLSAPRFKAKISLPEWSVRGTSGDRLIKVRVVQPADRCVTIPYTDPDGSSATCVNTERADATVEIWRREAKKWVSEQKWELSATAHAEVGSRP